MLHCTVHTILCRNAGHHKRRKAFFSPLFAWFLFTTAGEHEHLTVYLHTHGVLAKLNWVPSMKGKHNVTRKRAREVHLLQQFGVTVDLTCNLISCLLCTENLIFKLPLVDRNHVLYLWNNNEEVILVFNNKNDNNYNNSNYKLYEIKCDRMHFNSTLL